jgi:hypothetical protein
LLIAREFGFSGGSYRTKLGWNEYSALNIARSLAEPVPQMDVHDATGNSELMALIGTNAVSAPPFYLSLGGGNRIEAVRKAHGDGTPPADVADLPNSINSPGEAMN